MECAPRRLPCPLSHVNGPVNLWKHVAQTIPTDEPEKTWNIGLIYVLAWDKFPNNLVGKNVGLDEG
jgi:hypothetical protein